MMWIARDKNGKLTLFLGEKPVREGDEWCTSGECCDIESTWFSEITWESDPVKVNIDYGRGKN